MPDKQCLTGWLTSGSYSSSQDHIKMQVQQGEALALTCTAMKIWSQMAGKAKYDAEQNAVIWRLSSYQVGISSPHSCCLIMLFV